jgi:flagellar assembly protein FliH
VSSLLRAEAIEVRGHRPPSLVSAGHRRLLRSDQVDVDAPRALAVPVLSVGGLDEPPVVAEVVSGPSFEQEAEAARLAGYNAGYEQGYAEGLAAAEAVMARSIQDLSRIVGSVVENHAEFFRAAERHVVDLALQIAQRVVEHEIENMPDLAVNVIRAALDEMDARTAVRVRVNPDDQELLRRRWAQVVPPGIGPDRIELQPDERVQTGGAIIETTHGQVDAQLESKLQQLGNALWTFVMDVNSQDEQAADVDA